MRTIIAGSRSIKDYRDVVEGVEASGFEITEVVSGRAKGVDSLGERWANEHGVPIAPFPADWDNIEAPNAVIRTRRDGKKYNVKAGLDRNCDMADYADALIAIWDGKSTGTSHMIDQMRSRGKKVFVWIVKPREDKEDAMVAFMGP